MQTPSSYVDRRKARRTAPEQFNPTVEKEDDRARRKYRGRYGSESDDVIYPEERLHSAESRFRSPWPLSPSRALVESWDAHIPPLVVSQFSFPVHGQRRVYGALECIPKLLKNTKSDSVLYLATQAVGYAYFANKTHSPGLIASRRTRYGRALQALRFALHDPILQKQDGTLLAVWLLCFYEVSLFDSLGTFS